MTAAEHDEGKATEEADEGIIYPPPEIKVACDKTAQFVAKNGIGFEERIRDKELHNPKFCFLNPHDPYHAYYQLQIKNIKMGNAAPPSKPSAQNNAQSAVSASMPPPPPDSTTIDQPKAIPLPPPANEYLGEIPSLSKQDIQILKLTAQFVARNGTKFMTALSQREHKNYQFDFLSPSHSLYPYFTKLVEQYTRILVPPRTLFQVLEEQAGNRYKVLDQVMQRVEYQAYIMHEQEQARIEADKEKIAFATIDWHDFVVVETIEFFEADNRAVLPPPLSIMELQSLTLEQRKGMLSFGGEDDHGEDDMEMDEDMDMDMDEDEAPAPVEEKAPIILPSSATVPGQRYVPKVGRHAKSQATQLCTICNNTIKLTDMAEHVRMELQDPRYREKRAALQAKERDSNLVQGDVVAENLKKMTSFRSDIFGSGSAGEATLSQKLEFEAEKQKQMAKSKVIWDGHSGSVPLAQAKMQSIVEHNRIHPPANPPPPPPPMTGPVAPGKNAVHPPPPPPPAGDSKRAKTNANANALMLIVTLQNGDPITFSDLTPLWTVSQLKERIAPLSGMAVGKQKLVTASGTVLKNSLSLFESGVKDKDVLTLQTKERSRGKG